MIFPNNKKATITTTKCKRNIYCSNYKSKKQIQKAKNTVVAFAFPCVFAFSFAFCCFRFAVLNHMFKILRVSLGPVMLTLDEFSLALKAARTTQDIKRFGNLKVITSERYAQAIRTEKWPEPHNKQGGYVWTC